MLSVEGIVDRPFNWGQYDCYGNLADLYLLNFNIKLTNYARPTDWSPTKDNLIERLYERDGFDKISNWKLADLRPGDVMVMAVLESHPNHLAIYLGDNKFSHHLYGRPSSVEPMAGHWIHATCFLLRHPDVPDMRPVLPETTLEELLRARYQN